MAQEVARVWFSGAVHPAADVFPMLPEDDLRELAEDIRQNGLIHPVVLDQDGTLIDGRNRLAACRLAGVEPTFTTLNGYDPVAYILSSNINRRHLSKGQQAMAVVEAQAISETEKKKLVTLVEETGVKLNRLGEAAVVHTYAPDLVASVLSGANGLDAAYEEARRRKVGAESTEARLSGLRAEAPDLAVLVVEERMTLLEAEAAARERGRLLRERQTLATRQASDTFRWVLVSLANPAIREEFRANYRGALARPEDTLSKTLLQQAAALIAALAEEWPA